MIDFNSNSAFTNVYLGSFQLSRMYVGDNQVWPETTPPPTPTGYSTQYLTLRIQEGSTYFTYSNPNYSDPELQYSLDSGNTWTSLGGGSMSPTLTSGDTVMLKGTLNPSSSTGACHITISNANGISFAVEGNVMSLLYGDNFADKIDLTEKGNYVFNQLFNNNWNLTSAANLVLPATTLTNNCYRNMFNGCKRLTDAPAIPASTLTNSCCYGMYSGCTSLQNVPDFSATTLDNYACEYMFYGCSSLTTAPELPATTLGQFSCAHMFDGCTSLVTAPQLSATSVAMSSCDSMFYGCSSLTTAPSVLPATTLANSCYSSMFGACTSLTVAPQLPATTLADSCYRSMFQGCSSLTTAPVLPATTLVYNCYRRMFYNCSGLNSVTCLATDISANQCTYQWLNYVAATGTFTKAASMTSWTTGDGAIPSNWTVVDAS